MWEIPLVYIKKNDPYLGGFSIIYGLRLLSWGNDGYSTKTLIILKQHILGGLTDESIWMGVVLPCFEDAIIWNLYIQ